MNFTKNIRADYDLVVYAALGLIALVIATGMLIVTHRSKHEHFGGARLRFACAAFTGLVMLLVFAACLYYTGKENSPSQEIFSKGLLAISTLAGSIIGFLFASTRLPSDSSDIPELNERVDLSTSIVPKNPAIAKTHRVAKETDSSKEPDGGEAFGLIREFGLVPEGVVARKTSVASAAGAANENVPAKEHASAKERISGSSARASPRVAVRKREVAPPT